MPVDVGVRDSSPRAKDPRANCGEMAPGGGTGAAWGTREAGRQPTGKFSRTGDCREPWTRRHGRPCHPHAFPTGGQGTPVSL